MKSLQLTGCDFTSEHYATPNCSSQEIATSMTQRAAGYPMISMPAAGITTQDAQVRAQDFLQNVTWQKHPVGLQILRNNIATMVCNFYVSQNYPTKNATFYTSFAPADKPNSRANIGKLETHLHVYKIHYVPLMSLMAHGLPTFSKRRQFEILFFHVQAANDVIAPLWNAYQRNSKETQLKPVVRFTM